MIGSWTRAGVLLLSLLSVPAGAADDRQEALRSADAAWQSGRLEEAASAYRYAAMLDPADLEAVANQALVLRDLGKGEQALPLWIKATLLKPEDPFLWEARGWASLEAGRHDEARSAFKTALELSTRTALSWNAAFGHGWTELLDRQPRAAAAYFKLATLGSPFNAAPPHLLASLAEEEEALPAAMTHYQSALRSDAWMRESQEGLARVYLGLKQPEAEWQLLWALTLTDPGDEGLQKRLKKAGKVIGKPPEKLVQLRRVAWPITDKPAPVRPGLEARVALFADGGGRPASLAGFSWVSNSPFRLIDGRLGDVAAGGRTEFWTARVDPVNGLLNVRSASGRDSYATRAPLEIVPTEPGADLVLKNVQGVAAPGRDLGDRELRGRLLLQPVPGGFVAVLTTPLEDWLRGAVASAASGTRSQPLLKALAVVMRSRARARLGAATLHPAAGWSLCDSGHCDPYLGVQEENPDASRAVSETEGEWLEAGGAPALALDHEACGGRTRGAAGSGAAALTEVADSASARLGSPYGVERWTQSQPPEDLLCSLIPADSARVRWTRVLPAAEVEERLGRLGLKGRLKALRAGRRSPDGRLLTLEAVGTGGPLTLEGNAIADALSPGTLRSTLFTLRLLGRGRRPEHVLLWGAGTGHGFGLCRAGAEGMASQGYDHRAILRRYFPAAELKAAAPVPPGKGSPKAR